VPAATRDNYGAPVTTTDFPSELPPAGDELQTLHGALERIRKTFAWKCGGLDAGAMRVTLGPSTVTLGGLLKHLAYVEDENFTWSLLGAELGPPWDSLEVPDPEWAWRTAADDTAEHLMGLWEDAVARSRAAVAVALAGDGLDRIAARSPDGEPLSLRRMIVDVNEEYARHTGHADLIRESIDGLIGDYPPG
jgi:Protein of unknown function (DUF664)